MAELKLNITFFKVLQTIMDLNKNGFYPVNEGVFKILTGQKDDETLQFSNLETYSTLISYSSKKICNLTLMLYRYKYLEKVYDEKTNELYFKVTKLGEDALSKYLKSRPKRFVRKEIEHKQTIIKIENIRK